MDHLWPQTARFDEGGELWIGGCAAGELARDFGTPLYVFDEASLRARAREYQEALRDLYPGSSAVAYASKAYLSTALVQLWQEEGLELDVVSGGELYLALAAGFPPERIHFHGNNKSRAELEQALDAGVARIVVDNFDELSLLDEVAAARGVRAAIWLRVSPGIEAHTHSHLQTGQLDTKFGFPLPDGTAAQAVAQAMAAPNLELTGLHAHIGSQIYEGEPLARAAGVLAAFAAEMRDGYGFVLRELSPGGGWGVPMTERDPAAPVRLYVEQVTHALAQAASEHGLPLPHLVLEPGRSLVAQAAVTLYRVGARKPVPGVRNYVSVDGGMADNIRPALYGAKYTAARVGKPEGPGEKETVTIAGKFCETGDIMIRDIALPRIGPGDLLAVPMAGAYTLAMASNYNLAPKPAVLLVADGQARIMQRREAFADLVRRDAPLRETAPHGLRFRKYHGLGNDYIVIDPLDFPSPPSSELARRICDRHYGPGSDGVLWGPLRNGGRTGSGTPEDPFVLRLFNPDGGEFEKSGNGLRIFARYLWDLGLPAGHDYTILTPGGAVVAHVLDAQGNRIAMEMGTITFDSHAIPATGPARELVEEEAEFGGERFRITAVNIGNPHCVLFVPEPTPELAHRIGPLVEHSPLFPERINVQFARALDPHTLQIEIWERGAAYTLASGTSSCAATGAAIRTGRCQSPVTVKMPGGEMLVEVDAGWNVRLTGSVAPVFSGELDPELLRGTDL